MELTICRLLGDIPKVATLFFFKVATFNEIYKLIAATEKDAESFYVKKNGAAGTRLRKAYLEIKNLAAEGRIEVQ